jgi:hypothetical protein
LRSGSAPRLATAGLLVLVVLGVAGASAGTPGISGGEVVTYDVLQTLTYQSPGGLVANAKNSSFSITVVSVNNSAPPGSIQYSETYAVFNNVTQTANNTATGVTVFFNPYSNKTYLVKLAFYPFIYTDLLPGTATVQIGSTVSGAQGGDTTLVQRVRVNVTRTTGAILVNFTAEASAQVPRSSTALVYNATTGIMTRSVTVLFAAGALQTYTYRLVGVGRSPPQGFPAIGLVVGGAFILVGVAFVADMTLGRRRKGKRAKRMRALGPEAVLWQRPA